MTDHERLREQYEDALFALLMEGVAEAEGEEALRLNEELKKDPNAEVPKEVQKRCEKTIRSAFAQKQLRATGRTAARWLTRVAVVAALGGVMFTAAFALSEDVRVATLNALIQVMDDRTQISFGETKTTQSNGKMIDSGHIVADWLPDGYRLTNEYSGSMYTRLSFSDESDSFITIEISQFNQSTVYNFDSESTTQKEITVNGHEAYLYTKNDDALRREYADMPQIRSEMTILWIDLTNQTIWNISATNLAEEDIIQVAEGVRWAE